MDLVRVGVDRSSRLAHRQGGPIKKVLFPAEVLPIVSVLANMVHFFLGLPILFLFLIWSRNTIPMPAISSGFPSRFWSS